MPTPAAGWYPDPSASPTTPPTLRWWDGGQWTDHAAPALQITGGSAPTTPDGMPIAPYGKRVGAYVIDSLIVGTVGSLLQLPLLVPLFDTISEFNSQVDPATGQLPDGVLGDFFVEGLQLWLISIAISIALSFAYHTVCLRFWARTPGKRVLDLRVRRWETDGPLGWGTALKRAGTQYVLFGLLSLLFVQLLDLLWPAWDRRRQALHDKLAGTAVVEVSPADAR